MTTIQRSQFTDIMEVVGATQMSVNPASLADAVGATTALTVTGARLGDFVLVAAPYDLQDIVVTAYVQADDLVEIRVQNESAGGRNLADGVWNILVLRVSAGQYAS